MANPKIGDRIIHSSGERYVSGTIVDETETEFEVRTRHQTVDLLKSHIGQPGSNTLVFPFQQPLTREDALILLGDMRRHAAREAELMGEGFSNEWMKFAAEQELRLIDFLVPVVEKLPTPEQIRLNEESREYLRTTHEKATEAAARMKAGTGGFDRIGSTEEG